VIPRFIQANFATPQTQSTTSVSVPYTGPQTAGDLNVVIAGWDDTTAQISSVTDTNHNAYQLAAGPTVGNGLSQSIYYAKNIAGANAGANVVKVTYATGANSPDVRIVEYNGIDRSNPLDVATGSTGNSATSSTSSVTTTNNVDLLVGGNYVGGETYGPGGNFEPRLLTTPDQDIAEDHVVLTSGSYSGSAVLTDASTWVMQMVAFRAAPPDITPPTVSITAPLAGATLTGTVSVTVNASDTGTGVAGVQLQVDGIGLTVNATRPYTFTLNTSKFSNGSHSLTASARDFTNNVGNSSPVSVTFSNSNPGNPAQVGLFSGTVPLPIVSVHSALLPNGKILMTEGQTSGAVGIVWDSATGWVDQVPVPVNAFCSGSEQMADGRIMVVGGHANAHVGLPAANIFDSSNLSWTVLPDMTYPRWYPTNTMLADGRLIVTSGETNCDECDETIQEIYNPATNSWSQLSSAPFFFPYYPHVFILPDSRILVASDTEAPIVSEVLNLSTLTWTSVGGSAVDGGSSAMYLPGKILKAGKSTDPDLSIVPSVATAYVLDMTQPSPAWVPTGSMNFARTFHMTTLLPDGTVLVTGGGPTTNAVDVANAILPVEVWSPATNTWTTLASMSAPRLYHSEALLLPDGRVMVHGGGEFNGVGETTDQLSAEFFAPPYLFKGQRPAITSAPSQISYGQNFTVQTPDAARIANVSLLRFGATTHDINMGQRFLPLSFTAGNGFLTIIAPANSALAPAGNYMLFILDSNGIPSVSAVVHF
jgi:hypothetical protein